MGSSEVERRFRAVFDRCYRPVLAYALRRSDTRVTAEDIAAETFLVAWRRIGDLPANDDEVLPWLFGVARHVLSNTRRGDARRDRLIARLHQQRNTTETDSETDGIIAANDSRADVVAALERLRPADAEVLQLAIWEQLTHAQIAVVLDCSVNAVAIRVYRARKAFAAGLQKDERAVGHSELTDPTMPPPTGE